MPPHLIGDLEIATFSNIEHQSIDFVVHTIRPWIVRWEHAIQKALIPEEERAIYLCSRHGKQLDGESPLWAW